MLNSGVSRSYSIKPELLSPAGDWESLQAAVLNGADAVYLGTREFNARVHARNFSMEDLGKGMIFCHSQGVKVYLTMNILVKNSELKRFFDILSRAYSLGIDGVIIQHVSFLEIIKSNYPSLAVFMSTQSAIGNTASAGLLRTADRIILPREMAISEIKKIVNSGIKVEIFVHGALCFGYSGQCLFSSFVSNRSGNRGCCAQLCRQKYNGNYPLSTRELCLVRQIPTFIKAGITAFKIEGRMRSPLYVAVATRLYRKAIDSFLQGEFVVPKKEMEEIEIVFNREFTEGLICGDRTLISSQAPMNRGAYLGEISSGQVVLKRSVAVGDGLGIWRNDTVTGAVIQEITRNGSPVESAFTGDTVDLHLGAKEGARIYLTSSRRIKIEPDFTIKRAPIVPPRRKKIEATLPVTVRRKAGEPLIMSRVYSTAEAWETAKSGADIVFYNILAPDFPSAADWDNKSVLGAYVPRILTDGELNLALTILKRKSPGALLTGNLGLLAHFSEFNQPIYLDYNLNVFNDIDILYFRRYNAIPILSPELALAEMTELKDRNAVVFCHGDVVLVNTRIEIEARRLIDEKGFAFPVRKEGSYWQILNSRPFGMFNDVRKLRTIGFRQLFVDHQGKNADAVALYTGLLQKSVPDRRLRKGYTAGHIYRPVE
jgi:collagenase-like PrtC family protease